MKFAQLILKSRSCEYKLGRMTVFIRLVYKPWEIKCQIQEVLHVMGQQIVANILTFLVFFMEETNS